MKQIELSKKAKISARHVSDLKQGKRQFTKKMADLFEVVTGIPSHQWMYPERFGNPWAVLKTINPDGDTKKGDKVSLTKKTKTKAA